MSTKGEILYHHINGTTEQTWDGFSWPGFFFGAIWLLFKQLWVHFLISILIILATSGIGAIPVWLFYGFSGNSIHKKHLLSKGYLNSEQYAQNNRKRNNKLDSSNIMSVADELSKLSELKNSGVLTEEEFSERKNKLLNSD